MSKQTPRKSLDSLSSPILSPSSPLRPNEYPFPRFEVSQRPGSSSRYQSRRGSVASSIHSIGGTLDTSMSWQRATDEASQNAISTLLQPPIVRTGLLPHTTPPPSSLHRAPTAKDIPPVTLTNLEHVEDTEFQPYLSQVGALYNALQRAKDAEEDDAARFLRKKSATDDFSDLFEVENGRPSKTAALSRQASMVSLRSLTPLEKPKAKKRPNGPSSRRTMQASTPTPLSTIPNVYFEEDFHLENPRTFDVVSERSEVVRPTQPNLDDRHGSNGTTPTPRKALATNAILQEKLSWYMDTVEIHLITSISSASTSFFAALGSLRELHSEAAESVERIKVLRNELDALDNEIAGGALNIVNKRRKRENMKRLGNAMQQVRLITQRLAHCEKLIDGGLVEQGLDAMDVVERLVSGEQEDRALKTSSGDTPRQLQDLRGARALSGISGDFTTLRLRGGKIIESRFVAALLDDLRQHINSTPQQDTLQRWSVSSQRNRSNHNREPSAYPRYLTTSKEFRTQLREYLNGLQRAHYTISATTTYRDAVLRETKSVIKRSLPSSNDDDADSIVSTSTAGRQLTQQDRSTILARNLRALEPLAAEQMLAQIYVGISESLRRLGSQVKLLLDITSTVDEAVFGNGPQSPNRTSVSTSIESRASQEMPISDVEAREIQEEMHQALDLSNLLGQAVDSAQTQIIKVLRVRNEQSIHQTPTQFLRYFTLNLLFANECEAVSGRSGTSLKTLVNTQISDYIKVMGDNEQQKLAQGMDKDEWNAVDFEDADAAILSRVLEASDRDPESWTSGTRIWLPYDELKDIASKVHDTQGSGMKDKTKSVSAIIDSESFILPVAATLCLRGLEPYLQLITGLPSLTSDIAASMLAFLQLFNSRCHQLILGAGATKTVGLKNITTKHLALASQALSFIATLVPYMREHVRRHMGSGPAVSSMMGEFDKVRRAYQEHQSSISDKLIEIMSGRATVQVKAMRNIVWDEPSSTSVSPYMDTLTKDTTILHKALRRHMPEASVLMIMDPVFKNYRAQLGKAFSDGLVGTRAGKQRMLADAEAFNTKLGKLTGFGDTGEHLIKLVQEKKVLEEKEKAQLPTAPVATHDEPKASIDADDERVVEITVRPTPPV